MQPTREGLDPLEVLGPASRSRQREDHRECTDLQSGVII